MANSNRTEDSLKPQAIRVLEMLRAHPERGVSNGDFIRAYIERFGGRICEMRKLGWVIETVREGQGRSRYFLRAEPSGLGADAPLPVSTEPGGNHLARSNKNTAVAGDGRAIAPPGGGATLFDVDDLVPRRQYADPEEVAAA
jgi:hypothetical protein